MSYEIKNYACGICHIVYDTVEEADKCEATGLPEQFADLDPGMEIMYHSETPLPEGGYSYDKVIGTLIGKSMSINKYTKEHAYALLVDFDKGGKDHHEALLVMATLQGEEGEVLFSPAILKYKPGFHKTVKHLIVD